ARATVHAVSGCRRGLRPGVDPAPRRMARRRRVRRRALELWDGRRAGVRRRAADAPGACVQRVGAGFDGLQLEMRARHRVCRAPVIGAMAECNAVCERPHLPLQSGSTRLLKAMRRTYSRERYLRLVGELRGAIPGLALTTDLIVGFPGEREDDFRETLEAVEEVGFDSAFTFVFSPRRGTEAATMPGQVPDELKAE